MIIRIKIIAIVIMVLAVSLHAQESPRKYPTNETRIEYAKKNILMGLRSGNDGVVEASLILIAKIKMKFPETNIAELQPIIDSIAFTGFSNILRYKAYLASNICTDPEWFSTEITLEQTGIDVFFLSASQRLQNKLLGINSF